ncbi:hypothetical protein OAB00_00145 [Akkermansiaceae bacterium]|nr:hypothetical protein [Akkermansiaceae bacterium]
MRPLELANNNRDFTDEEIAWDHFGITRHDFSSHWNGDLVNLCTAIKPQSTILETEIYVIDSAKSIAEWVLNNQDLFKPQDRYQIIIEWPLSIRETSRHIIKTGGTLSQLKDLVLGNLNIKFYPSWHKEIIKN